MITTNLGGEKLSKSALQIHLLGTLDELNAHLGLVKVKICNEGDKLFLEAIQKKLMKMMSHVSDPSNKEFFFTELDTAELEKEIVNLKNNLRGEINFTLPGKNEQSAFADIARTVARRAERYFTAVSESAPLCPNAASYLNKLSEYLFYLSENPPR